MVFSDLPNQGMSRLSHLSAPSQGTVPLCARRENQHQETGREVIVISQLFTKGETGETSETTKATQNLGTRPPAPRERFKRGGRDGDGTVKLLLGDKPCFLSVL